MKKELHENICTQVSEINNWFCQKTKNLKYPLHNESLIIGYRTGSSNEVLTDGIVIIEHQEGDLLIMECWD